MRKLIASGNELVALAAFDADCRFFGGYPITPSSEVMHQISVSFPKDGRKFIQMEDEIAAILAAIGASVSGKKAMTNTSGPGMSLKAESIGLAYMMEVPLVIVNVMRGGPSTGLPTRVAQGDVLQSRSPTHGDIRMIVVAPGTFAECYTETIRAFNLAERFMQPVILLLDETLGHMTGDVEIPDVSEVKKGLVSRRVNTLDTYHPYGVADDEPAILNPFFTGHPYHVAGLAHDKTGFPTEDIVLCQKLIDRLFRKVEAHLEEVERMEKYLTNDAEYLIVCYGSVALSAMDAIVRLRKEGIRVGMFRPITLWPSPDKRMFEIAKRFSPENILVVELNKGQYLQEVQRSMRIRPAFLSKVNGRPIASTEIAKKIMEMHHVL